MGAQEEKACFSLGDLLSAQYPGTVMMSYYYALMPTCGSWFKTNQPEHESDGHAGDPVTSVCVTNEKDTALQWQIWSTFVTVLWSKVWEATRKKWRKDTLKSGLNAKNRLKIKKKLKFRHKNIFKKEEISWKEELSQPCVMQ